MKKLNETVQDLLLQIRGGILGEVIYKFADDTTQVNPINKEVFLTEKGTYNSIQEVYKLFVDTQYDRGAVSFYISI